MNPRRDYDELTAALRPLGVEVGPELLALWLDRQRDGRDPLPLAAVRGLAGWATRRLAERLEDGERAAEGRVVVPSPTAPRSDDG